MGMDDAGMAALASVVRAGRFEKLEEITLSFNPEVTDQGACVFARAIESAGERGLPKLRWFVANRLPPLTTKGVGALAFALIKNCPRLVWMCMQERDSDDWAHEMVEGFVSAAGCGHRLGFNVHEAAEED